MAVPVSSDDTYDPDRLTYDRELLRKFYLSQGYADFRVVSAVAELDARSRGLLRHLPGRGRPALSLRQGRSHQRVEGRRPGDAQALADEFAGRLVQRRSQSTSSVTALTNALGDRGYAFVQVTADRSSGTSIAIRSTSSTTSRKAPRSMSSGSTSPATCAPRTGSSAANSVSSKATPSTRRSSTARSSASPISASSRRSTSPTTRAARPTRRSSTSTSQEQSTGEFQVGIGYSTTDGPLANIGIHERNLLGRGQDLRLARRSPIARAGRS